jgi:pimeloyl-ACP methyl ester carboxylesterase
VAFDLDWHDAPDPGAPLVVLIHGLGVTGRFWRDPAREPIAGGLLSTGHLMPLPAVVTPADSRPPRGGLPRWLWPADPAPRASPWAGLARAGLALGAYTQDDSHAAMTEAVAELEAVLAAAADRRPRAPLALVGHSRGGLIARRLLETRPEAARRVRALITLGTPHAGSALAALAGRGAFAAGMVGAALARAIGARCPRATGDTAGRVAWLRQAGGLARSPAVRELVPGSAFLATLAALAPPGVAGYSVVGTRPTHFRCYRLRPAPGRPEGEARAWLTLPDGLARGPGRWLLPAEWRPGSGDGSVSVARGRLPWARAHRAFPCNHLELVADPVVQAQVLAWIREACGPWGAGAAAKGEAACPGQAALL